MNPIALLFRSRKFVLALFSGSVGAVLCALGKLQVEHLAGFVAALTIVLIHSISREDVAAKLKGTK